MSTASKSEQEKRASIYKPSIKKPESRQSAAKPEPSPEESHDVGQWSSTQDQSAIVPNDMNDASNREEEIESKYSE